MFNMMGMYPGMPGMGPAGQMRPGMPLPNAAPPPIQMRQPMGGGMSPPPMMAPPQQGQGGAMGGMPQIMQLLAAMKGDQAGVPGAQLPQALPGGAPAGGSTAAKIANMPEWVGGIFGNMKADGAGMPPIDPTGGALMDSLGAAPLGFAAPTGMPAAPIPGMPPALPWWLGGAG